MKRKVNTGYIKMKCGKAYADGYAKALKDAGLDNVNKVIEGLKETR